MAGVLLMPAGGAVTAMIVRAVSIARDVAGLHGGAVCPRAVGMIAGMSVALGVRGVGCPVVLGRIMVCVHGHRNAIPQRGISLAARQSF